MTDIYLTSVESAALHAVRTGDLSDPVKLMRDAGCDVSTFFEYGDYAGGDFSQSDITGVSFRGADLLGTKFRADQLPIVMTTRPRRGPLDDVDISPEDSDDAALEDFMEARRRISVAKSATSERIDLSNLRSLRLLPPEIAELTALRHLSLHGTQVADIALLAGMVGMQTLALDNTKVTDITPLAHMEEMQALYLSETQVAEIAPLANMSRLQELILSDTHVADVAPLARMEGLQTLTLDGTMVADLTPLARMERMRTLNLDNTRVADLTPLANMSQLRELVLSDTRVATIAPLARMGGMQRLVLSATQADLSELVLPAAAWAEEDRDFFWLEFDDTPLTAPGEVLSGLYEERLSSADRTAKALRLLREARDWDEGIPMARADASTTFRPYVLLSYARADAERAATLRKALERDGVAIWQETDMSAGVGFGEEIEAKLEEASAVLVLWSSASIGSQFVRSEAEMARAAGKLVPALLDESSLQTPFENIVAADLSEWHGNRRHRQYLKLLEALQKRLTQMPEVEPNTDGRLRLAERPVDEREPRAEDLALMPMLAAQAKLARRTAKQVARAMEMGTANMRRDLPERLNDYAEELESETPGFWEFVDEAFSPAAALMRSEEADEGLGHAFAALKTRHEELRDFLQPLRPSDGRQMP